MTQVDLPADHYDQGKDLAAEITNFNVKKKDLKGENPITSEHVKNNKDVRDLLAKSGIRSENLPLKKISKNLSGESSLRIEKS